MRTQYSTATSLDGFIATEDDSLDWLFPLGDLNSTSYPGFIAASRSSHGACFTRRCGSCRCSPVP